MFSAYHLLGFVVPMSAKMRERITIRLTLKYLQLLDKLVEDGVYNSRNEAIRDGLRLLFEHYGYKMQGKNLTASTPQKTRSRNA